MGVSSVLAVGGFLSPASADGPTAVAECNLPGDQPEGVLRLSGFPASESFSILTVVQQGGHSYSNDGSNITTDSTGAATFGRGQISSLPVGVAVAIYRDTNHDGHWNPDVDDTLYRGSGTITTCPQTVTLSPK